MEYIQAILYHKIQDSDFTNMYGLKKPTSGGGQTYIQAAGYTPIDLDRMFAEADEAIDTEELWHTDKPTPRKLYRFKTCEVGSTQTAIIELAPRKKRKDYRISRQNIKHRHPAWSSSSGFPEPHKSTMTNQYVYEENYPGLIDNLFVLIIKTKCQVDSTYKFYATYVDSADLPDTWVEGVKLEDIFAKEKRQGIIFFQEQFLRFTNDKKAPFQVGSAIDEQLGFVELPEDLPESEDDAVEFAQKDIELTLDYNTVGIEAVDMPTVKTPKRKISRKFCVKNQNYEQRNRNLKKIGDVGEKLAVEAEKRRLIQEGHKELAERVVHVSVVIGDGLGYDIQSFQKNGNRYEEKYIEVKATTGGINKPFDISANEVKVSAEKGKQYSIYRFFGIGNGVENIKYYEVQGSVSEMFDLEATMYKAYNKS